MSGAREKKKINYVNEINPRQAVTIKRNKCCHFIIPLIGYSYNWFYSLINAYLGDNTNKPDLTFQKIFIHVRYYDEKFLSVRYFNHYYRLEDNTYMFVYDIPDEFEQDYILFCDGKYSQMSQLAKDLICSKSGIRPEMDSLVYKILYKTKDQKEIVEQAIGCKLFDYEEVYARPNLDNEVYNGALKLYNTGKLELEEDE